MAKIEIPDVAYKWMTEEIKEALAAIKGPHIQKKRVTIIRLAFAMANQEPIDKVFGLDDTCNESTWYMKWQYEPEIRDAFVTCRERALEWADTELAAQEAHFRRERQRSIAKWSAQAPDALAGVMFDQNEKGGDRISAANSLMTWADPKAAGEAQPASPPSNTDVINIGFLANLTGDELDKLIDNAEAAARYSETREAAEAQSTENEGTGPADLDNSAPAEDRPQDSE